MPIIHSLLDTDLYKLTMAQVAGERFADARAEYAFTCRTPGVDLAGYADAVRAEIDALQALELSAEEAIFLRGQRFLNDSYVDQLSEYRFDPGEVEVRGEADGGLSIRAAGLWSRAIYWEVPLLAIVQELYTRHVATDPNMNAARERLHGKVERVLNSGYAAEFRMADFGTRRRYSRTWHDEVVATLARRLPEQFVGTSNLDLARRHGLMPIGTMAHEYLQAAQVLAPDLRHFQAFALEHWMQAFRGDLGIALTDVIGTKSFLADFDRLFVKAYDGLRHDSGDPFHWGDAAIAHFESYGIDPRTKTLIFSDGLDIERALEILEYFSGRVRVSFGIGTHLTNDIPGVEPLNLVMKMVSLNGRPVAKLSESPGKTMCEDNAYVERLRRLFDQPAERVA